MELCPLSPQDGAYVIMAQTNKLGKFNYSDAYSYSNHIICSFVECYFLQLMQIFVAKLIQNPINNIVDAKEILIRMTNNDQEWAATIIFITLSFFHFLFFSFCLFIYLFYIALFDISIWHIDCRYIDTFEKYRYRYQYRYGHIWKYRYRYR